MLRIKQRYVSMTNEEIRIAVAEELGWKWKDTHLTEFGATYPRKGWFDPNGNIIPSGAPDCPNDLNACHEMEKTLTEKEELFYLIRLTEAMKEDSTIGWQTERTYHATALQRCEAVLWIKSKWKKELK